jgi:CMP-N-acetylneuraminic acid synthetase
MRPISAVINARLESSRMKQKMIKPFAGTTLLDIALEKLNKLDFFEHRFFAVAEKALKEKAIGYPNIEILERKSKSVAPGPHPPTITFEHYSRVPTQYIFVINACAAFLSETTIRMAYSIFQETDYRSYVAAVPTRNWIFTRDGIALTHKDPDALQNTSHGEFFYKVTHSFYIIDRDFFMMSKGRLWTLTPKDPYLIEMPTEDSYDVDTDREFEFSAYMYSKMKKAN